MSRNGWRIADRVDMDRLRKVVLDGATPEQVSVRFSLSIGTARNHVYRIRKEQRGGAA